MKIIKGILAALFIITFFTGNFLTQQQKDIKMDSNEKGFVVEYIRYKIEPGSRTAFLKAYKEASKQLDESEFCLNYELTECEEEEGSFILRIEWTSTEEHLNGFRKSKLFPEFLSKIRPYIGNIQEMRHYKLTEVVKQ